MTSPIPAVCSRCGRELTDLSVGGHDSHVNPGAGPLETASCWGKLETAMATSSLLPRSPRSPPRSQAETGL
jgi:hypothetical protein